MQKIKQFLFVNSSTKQTFLKNTFWLFLSEATGRLFKMVLIIYAARILGANGWGVFSYALSLSSILMIFSDVGLSGLITREVVQEKEGHKNFISTALFLKGAFLFASTIIVIIISPMLSHVPEANVLLPITAMILFFDSVRDLVIAINRASERMEYEMVVTTGMNAVILGLGITLLMFNRQPESIAIAYAIGNAIGFFIIVMNLGQNQVSLLRRRLSVDMSFKLRRKSLDNTRDKNRLLGRKKTAGLIGTTAADLKNSL